MKNKLYLSLALLMGTTHLFGAATEPVELRDITAADKTAIQQLLQSVDPSSAFPDKNIEKLWKSSGDFIKGKTTTGRMFRAWTLDAALIEMLKDAAIVKPSLGDLATVSYIAKSVFNQSPSPQLIGTLAYSSAFGDADNENVKRKLTLLLQLRDKEKDAELRNALLNQKDTQGQAVRFNEAAVKVLINSGLFDADEAQLSKLLLTRTSYKGKYKSIEDAATTLLESLGRQAPSTSQPADVSAPATSGAQPESSSSSPEELAAKAAAAEAAKAAAAKAAAEKATAEAAKEAAKAAAPATSGASSNRWRGWKLAKLLGLGQTEKENLTPAQIAELEKKHGIKNTPESDILFEAIESNNLQRVQNAIKTLKNRPDFLVPYVISSTPEGTLTRMSELVFAAEQEEPNLAIIKELVTALNSSKVTETQKVDILEKATAATQDLKVKAYLEEKLVSLTGKYEPAPVILKGHAGPALTHQDIRVLWLKLNKTGEFNPDVAQQLIAYASDPEGATDRTKNPEWRVSTQLIRSNPNLLDGLTGVGQETKDAWKRIAASR